MKNFLQNLGPGILVSAAFIGPGTVTVCSIAGVHFGYSLLWALGLSILACIILQEMSARLGLISGLGLSENIRSQLKNPISKILALVLIFSAIVIGNAAYEAGNITGAVLGLEAVFFPGAFDIGVYSMNFWSLLLGGIAFTLLATANYKLLERVFIGLILLMSLSFIITAILTKPDFGKLIQGLAPGNLDAGLLTIIALVGTTVVPYNLFLHASLVSEKWKNEKELPLVRKELIASIFLGGLVSMAIMVCAASSNLDSIATAADLAVGLEPLFGTAATLFMGIGLFAAGITSSITAPLAAAYVVKGCLGWKGSLTTKKFKLVWGTVLGLGVIFSSLNINPVEIIQFAQITNGLILPIIAIFLLWMVNQTEIMGKYKNSLLQNFMGVMVIILALFLGGKSIFSVIQNF